MKGRVAGAPISWGVCEVPGRGYQLADREISYTEGVADGLSGGQW